MFNRLNENAFVYCIMNTAVATPSIPKMKETMPIRVGFSPIASSIPCMAYGVWQSHFW